MNNAEIEKRLEQLPNEIYEAEKELIEATKIYEFAKMKYEVQVGVVKVRVQATKGIPNNFAKDIATIDSSVMDLRTAYILAKIEMKSKEAEYNKKDRENWNVKVLSGLREKEIGRLI
jgi:hypothetical protein